MLSLVQRLFYGPESATTDSTLPADLRFRELAVLTPLVLLMLVMGLAPSLWLNSIQTGGHPPPHIELRGSVKPGPNTTSNLGEGQR